MKKKILVFFITIVSFSGKLLGQTPDTVKIGCYVISLHDINFHDEEYTARFWIWMVYKDKSINFKEDIEVPNAKSIDIDEYIEDTTSIKGKKWVQMKLKCVMKETYSIDDYPFDKQHLGVIIENSSYDTRKLIFMPDTLGKFYDPKMAVLGWNISHFKINTGLSHYSTGFGDENLKKPETDYSKFMINLDIERNAWGLFFKLFLGMYVAFAISYVSFFIDARKADPRFGLPVGGLFAGVGNKYIVDAYLPETSTITTVDILHGVTFVYIFLMIAISAVSLRYEEDGLFKQSQKTDIITRWTMGISYLLINIGVTFYAILHAATE